MRFGSVAVYTDGDYCEMYLPGQYLDYRVVYMHVDRPNNISLRSDNI